MGYRCAFGTIAAIIAPEWSVGRETGGQDCNATFNYGERDPSDVVVYWPLATGWCV